MRNVLLVLFSIGLIGCHNGSDDHTGQLVQDQDQVRAAETAAQVVATPPPVPSGCTAIAEGERIGWTCNVSGTFRDVPLTLTTTWTSEPVESAANGGKPLQIVRLERAISTGDKRVVRNQTVYTPGASGKPDHEITRTNYGDGVTGVKAVTVVVSDGTAAGTVDDRAFVPVRVDAAFSWEKLQFSDGQPPPTVEFEPLLKDAITEALPKLGAALPSDLVRTLAFGPVSGNNGKEGDQNTPLNWRTKACNTCEHDCVTSPLIWFAPLTLPICMANCWVPGHGCAQELCAPPGTCDSGQTCCGDLCCAEDQVCGNDELGICCPKDHPVACGDRTRVVCYDPGANCCPDGSTFACPAGQACTLDSAGTPSCCPQEKSCDGACCGDGQSCQKDANGHGVCCGGTMCGNECCANGSTCNNGRCGFGQVCGDTFCGLGSQCCGGACCNGTCVNGSVCCPTNRQACGNACCNEGDSCVNGACTAPAKPSTILYRPDGSIVSTSAGQVGFIFGGNHATLKGDAFPAGAVSIWTSGKNFGTATAGANGKFVFDVNTAGLAAGRWTIVATRGSRSVSLAVNIAIPK